MLVQIVWKSRLRFFITFHNHFQYLGKQMDMCTHSYFCAKINGIPFPPTNILKYSQYLYVVLSVSSGSTKRAKLLL